MADDLRAQLGIKRRRDLPGAGGDGTPADPKKEEGPAEKAPEAEKANDLRAQLGIKRRRAPGADGAAAAPAEGASAEEAADDGPEAPPPRRLGSDEAAVWMAKLFKRRPGLVVPERAFTLPRAQGHYLGDGRPDRRLVLGWEPALVLYTMPTYPDQTPGFTDDWKVIDPGLHRQPAFVEDGFVVDEPFNRLGEGYMYVAFRSDGTPLVERPAARSAPEDDRKRGTAAGDVIPGLGVRRRSRPSQPEAP